MKAIFIVYNQAYNQEIVDDILVAEIMDRLRSTDSDNPNLGLRAYVLPVEDAI